MAVSTKEQRLLSMFPNPPSAALAATPTGPKTPNTGQTYRASDFGFITVGLCAEDNGDDINKNASSLYNDPCEAVGTRQDADITPTAMTNWDSNELYLVLDNPTKLYSPCETITGYISGWDYTSHPSSHVHIILEGKAKSHISNDKLEYQSCAPLIYQILHLRAKHQGIVPRFSIDIPERVAGGIDILDHSGHHGEGNGERRTRYWTRQWPVCEPYQYQPNHPLPPSMTLPTQAPSGLTYCITGSGQILYKLLAIRSHTDPHTNKLKVEARCQVPIWLTTRRFARSKTRRLINETHTDSQELSIQTTALLKERRLSLREQFRDAFDTSAPCFYFASTTRIPKVAVPGGQVEIRVSVAVRPPPVGKPYNFSIPDIRVKSLDLHLRSYTGMRILRSPTPHANPHNITQQQKPLPLPPRYSSRFRSYTFKGSPLRTRTCPTATFIPVAGDFVKQSCVIIFPLPKSLIPSFTTYNVWRGYRLECEVAFYVAGKEVVMRTWGDLNVVARPVECGDAPGYGEDDDEASLKMAQTLVEAGEWA